MRPTIGRIQGAKIKIHGDREMKPIMISFLTCGLLTGICFGNLEKTLAHRFASVTARADGLLIVFKEMSAPYRVSVHFNDPTKIRYQGSASELGEYFIPYDQKWPVWIGRRDTGIQFDPLNLNDPRKGFYIRDQNLIPGGREETTGVFLYVDRSIPNDRSYDIVDEKYYKIGNQVGGTEGTNVYTRVTSQQPDIFKKSTLTEEISLSKGKLDDTKARLTVIQNSTSVPESMPQNLETTRSSFWGKLMIAVVVVFLVGLFSFFKFRKS